jgi:hypothetical protein
MSYDLCYWCVGSDDDERSPGEIYEGLCEDGEVDGLVWLSVSEIKARFQEAFPTIEDFGTELNWEGEATSFQVSWPIGSTPQHTLGLIVHCSWSIAENPDVIDSITRVAATFGCGLYDPQSNTWDEPIDPDAP